MIVDNAILALTLYAEAGGETLEGKYAVADVIFNRKMKSTLSWREICLRAFQFSCWNDNILQLLTKKISDDKQSWRDCVILAEALVSGAYIPKYPFTNYYNPSLCNPKWGEKMTNATIIGNHKFGTL